MEQSANHIRQVVERPSWAQCAHPSMRSTPPDTISIKLIVCYRFAPEKDALLAAKGLQLRCLAHGSQRRVRPPAGQFLPLGSSDPAEKRYNA